MSIYNIFGKVGKMLLYIKSIIFFNLHANLDWFQFSSYSLSKFHFFKFQFQFSCQIFKGQNLLCYVL